VALLDPSTPHPEVENVQTAKVAEDVVIGEAFYSRDDGSVGAVTVSRVTSAEWRSG
jgi:hypothetical protein